MPEPAHRGPGVPAVMIFNQTSAKFPKYNISSHAIASA